MGFKQFLVRCFGAFYIEFHLNIFIVNTIIELPSLYLGRFTTQYNRVTFWKSGLTKSQAVIWRELTPHSASHARDVSISATITTVAILLRVQEQLDVAMNHMLLIPAHGCHGVPVTCEVNVGLARRLTFVVVLDDNPTRYGFLFKPLSGQTIR